MLRLSDFLTSKTRYYNQSRGVYISALEHCRKIKETDLIVMERWAHTVTLIRTYIHVYQF